MKRWMVVAALLPAGLAAQTVRVGAAPRVVTVGDRFQSVAEVALPAGARLLVDVPADSGARVRPVGAVRLAGGRATATMVAWSVGPASTVAATARIVAADGTVRPIALRLPVPEVRSVLPADTAGLKPRGPADVYGPDRRMNWPMILAAAAVVAWLTATGLWIRSWLRRRRERMPMIAPAGARDVALEALLEARRSGLAERGDMHGFYTMVGDALRGFAAALRPSWGPDLTTTELVERMTAEGVPPAEVAPLAAVLRTADLAKFGRYPVAQDTAIRDWDTARGWVRSFAGGKDER
jgi:hypothetical protein